MTRIPSPQHPFEWLMADLRWQVTDVWRIVRRGLPVRAAEVGELHVDDSATEYIGKATAFYRLSLRS